MKKDKVFHEFLERVGRGRKFEAWERSQWVGKINAAVEGDIMTIEKVEITINKIKARAKIVTAMIAVLGIIIGAILGPIVEKLINRPIDEVVPVSLQLEQIPQNIFAYAGSDESIGGWSALWLRYEGNGNPVYRLDYSLPTDQNGYAGMAFQFEEGQDLSEYKAVEITIRFYEPDSRIDFFIKDIAQNNAQMQVVAKGTNEAIIEYDFSNFSEVNFSAIKEIGLNVDTSVITGSHRVEIKNIKFVD